MNISKRARIAVTAGVGAVVVAAAGGVTYAVAAASQPTNDFATGCSGPHHGLKLFNSAGNCPPGFWRINLASAPTPIVIRNVSTTTVQRVVAVRGMQLVARCGKAGQSSLTFVPTTGNALYDVRGAYYLGQANSKGFYSFDGSNYVFHHSYGAGYISWTTLNKRSEILLQGGELNTALTVAETGHTFAVNLYVQNNANSCFVEAQISQSS